MTEPTWTPGPVEPERGPADPGQQPAQEQWDAGAGAAPAAGSPRRRGRGLTWGITAVVAAAAIGAGVWFLAPRMGQAAAEGTGLVDIREEPQESWSYRYVERGDGEWISSGITTRPLGQDRIALLTPLNPETYAEANTGGWYAGYDEHYATGFQDGTAYQAAYQEYLDDYWSTSSPDYEDYFSLEGVDYWTASSDPEYLGWTTGFEDASNERPEGSSKAARPEAPPTLGRVVVLDAGSGEHVWTVELTSLDLPEDASISLLPTSPEGHLPVVATGYDTDAAASTLSIVALDPDDGAVVSRAEFEGAAVAGTSGPTAPLVVAVDEGVVRLNTGDLSGDAVWSAGIGTATSLTVNDGFVQALLEDGPWWLDAETGFEPDWFDAGDEGISYRFIDDVVLRTESSSFGQYIDALDQSGKTLWTGDAESLRIVGGSGGSVLLTSELLDDSFEEYLMRLDPRTGEEMWEAEYDDEFWTVTGTVRDGLVLDEGERSVVLDLETGEQTQRLRGEATHLGSSVAYGSTDGRLRAWDVEDGSELWSMRMSDSEGIHRVGELLLVHDAERQQLSRLE